MKIIKVNNCKECPYMYRLGYWNDSWFWCQSATENNIAALIKDPNTIPSWCPLEDGEEKE